MLTVPFLSTASSRSGVVDSRGFFTDQAIRLVLADGGPAVLVVAALRLGCDDGVDDVLPGAGQGVRVASGQVGMGHALVEVRIAVGLVHGMEQLLGLLAIRRLERLAQAGLDLLRRNSGRRGCSFSTGDTCSYRPPS